MNAVTWTPPWAPPPGFLPPSRWERAGQPEPSWDWRPPRPRTRNVLHAAWCGAQLGELDGCQGGCYQHNNTRWGNAA